MKCRHKSFFLSVRLKFLHMIMSLKNVGNSNVQVCIIEDFDCIKAYYGDKINDLLQTLYWLCKRQPSTDIFFLA